MPFGVLRPVAATPYRGEKQTKAEDDSYATRSSLLRRVKDPEDEPSWEEFNDQYGKLIFRFAIKAGLTEDEAQEVVQETMIAAAKHLPEFRYDPKVCSFKTWLLNFSAWRVQDQVRKRRAPSTPPPHAPRGRPEDDTAGTATVERIPQPASGEFEALWDREWRTTLMDAAVARVKPMCPVKQWQIFDLYVLQEWSVREVTATLGVSAGRVYLAKHRVSALLRKELKRLERASFSLENRPGS